MRLVDYPPGGPDGDFVNFAPEICPLLLEWLLMHFVCAKKKKNRGRNASVD